MKKIYILAIAAFAFTLNMNAQFEDDFESYDEGTITDQADNFYNWSGDGGGAESGVVTSEQASNGTKSLYISTGNDFVFDFDGGVKSDISKAFIASTRVLYPSQVITVLSSCPIG